MSDTYISFYLKAGRIHVFIDSLRAINCPKRICFLMDNEGKNLLLVPYSKLDFKSHKVPEKVYKCEGRLEISSLKLCNLIADMKGWDNNRSYRVHGVINKTLRCIVFNLNESVKIS